MKRLSCMALVAIAALGSVGPAWAQSKNSLYYGVQAEELELRRGDENEASAAWNADAFIGTDELKLRWLGKGEYDFKGHQFESLENRIVLQTPVSDFFDIKGGVRVDSPAGPDRWFGTIGLSGLAPQWFEVDADLFVAETADVSARIDIEYELLLTNYLTLTPSAEIDMAFSDDTEVDIKSGLTSAEIGLRMSYDVVDRAFSPYVGAVYERKLGNTADLIESQGEDIEGWRAVIGFKSIF